MKIKKFIIFLVILIFSVLLYSQEELDTKNDNLRAFWTFNIANNVIWPNEDTISTYTIGVYSRNKNIYEELVKVSNNQTIKNKKVKVIYFTKPKSITYTHILYIGFDKNIDIFKINDILINRSTLLITDRLDDPDNIMVNIRPFDKITKRINIDRPNLEQHQLGVTDQLLYHGGSEEELKDLYSQQKKQLDIQTAEIEKKKEEIVIMQKNLEIQKQQLLEQTEELTKQKEKLLEMSLKMRQQEQFLQNNEQLLQRQEQQIANKQKEVQEKIKELTSQEKILLDKNTEIQKKQSELANLENQIDLSKTALNTANQKIETQNFILFYGAIFLAVIIIFSFFLWKALRKNNKMNKELKKKNNEILEQKNRIELQALQLENSNKELEKLSIVAENAQNGVVIMNKDGDFEWINAGFTKLYGFTLQLLINERDKNIIKASDNPEIEKHINKCISEKISVNYEVEASKRTGEKIWLKTTITPILNDLNEIEKLVAIETDITEIKEAEKAIKTQNEQITKQSILLEEKNVELEKLSVVVRETNNAVLITNANGDIEWINPAFTDTFGYTLEEFVGKVTKNIISNTTQEYVKKQINIMYETKKPVSYNFKTHNKNGDEIWLQANITPILDSKNEINKLIIVDSDITLIKKAEEQIIEKNFELTQQKEQIEEQNKQIHSSINYAQTIQKAILPLENIINNYFEFEVIFKPKDIVSGDFYWFFANENKNIFYAATVDCTGHGVPGAFMSLIASQTLNDIVLKNNDIQPHEILELADKAIISSLRQEHTTNNDGFDIVLTKIIKKENFFKILFAGAKRNLYFYSNKNNSINSINGNRRSIGGVKNYKNKDIFTSTELILYKNDILYLMTDGIIDQNDKYRKRMGSVKVEDILNQNKQKSLIEQKNELQVALSNQMQETEQRDDITILLLKLV